MKTVRLSFRHFWKSFRPPLFLERHPTLRERWHVELDDESPDLVVISCFGPQGKLRTPPVVETSCTRLFYTGENMLPDFRTCDFAISFARDVDDPRHLRLPNYVPSQNIHGFQHDALVRRAERDPAELRRKKTRFCGFVQRHPVPIRDAFVEKLSRYRRVHCAGPHLNNLGFTVSRQAKYDFLRECKFAITMENEAAPGYTTEKLCDGLLADSVPIYWGDPTVHLDFAPAAFVHLRDFDSLDACVEEVARLDQDDAAYEARLGAACLPDNELQPWARPETEAAFFERVFDAALAGRNAA